MDFTHRHGEDGMTCTQCPDLDSIEMGYRVSRCLQIENLFPEMFWMRWRWWWHPVRVEWARRR